MVISRDEHVLDEALKPAVAVRDRLIRQDVPKGYAAATAEEQTKFTADMQEILDKTIKVSLAHLKTSDMEMDKQDFGPGEIESLLPILDDDGK